MARSRRLALALLTALSLGLLLSACGGKNPLTESQLQERANKICAQRQARIASLPAATTIKEHETLATEQIALLEQEIASLRALEPPVFDRNPFKVMIGHEQKAVKALKSYLAAIKVRNTAARRAAASKALARLTYERRLFGVSARNLGINVCAGASAAD
jgi:predicted outer membrane protein